MAFNMKLYFTSDVGDIIFYDTEEIKNVPSGNITFRWTSNGINSTISIDEFKRNGFKLHNDKFCNFMVEIESNVDIMVGNSRSHEVYRFEGYLPNFSKNNKIINFDKSVLPVFDTSKVRVIGNQMLLNMSNVTHLNSFFSDHREWRNHGDNAAGNQLEFIPDGLLNNMSRLIELNGFMCRMDNILSIPNNLLNTLSNLKSIRAFNDCKRLSNIDGGRIISGYINKIIMYNNLDRNCFIPTNLVNCGGSGYVMIYMLTGCNPNISKVSFDTIINVPHKTVLFYSNLELDGSKNNNIVNCKYIESGRFINKSVMSDDDIVNKWVEFMNTNVLPELRNNGDFSDVRQINTISI